jgi:hypothetical protein
MAQSAPSETGNPKEDRRRGRRAGADLEVVVGRLDGRVVVIAVASAPARRHPPEAAPPPRRLPRLASIRWGGGGGQRGKGRGERRGVSCWC